MIDGKRTVKQIVHLFAESHRLHIKEAEVSVTAFLHELGKRGIIGIK
ncbi:PqqD family peptide modification chaperone [Thermodesulfobacteriota bacterium]